MTAYDARLAAAIAIDAYDAAERVYIAAKAALKAAKAARVLAKSAYGEAVSAAHTPAPKESA